MLILKMTGKAGGFFDASNQIVVVAILGKKGISRHFLPCLCVTLSI